MERTEEVWGLAQVHAHGFLRRFEDVWTRNERDDLVQETALAAWSWASSVRDPDRFAAAVRTIARRLRCRGLRRAHRQREVMVSSTDGCEPAVRDEEITYMVGGRRVPAEFLLACLRRALARLGALDRQLLLCLHEGFCGAELASRFRRSEMSLRVRAHRARRRLREEIESVVRAAGDLEAF